MTSLTPLRPRLTRPFRTADQNGSASEGPMPSPTISRRPSVDRDDEEIFDRRLDETQRRIRRLDERIVRTVATSTHGLLAQLRLLAAFYEESANGAGRRGSLLIQAIAEGVTQLEARRSRSPTISTGLGTSAGTGGR